MKKIFFKSMLLLCALIVGTSSAWADNETVTIASSTDVGTGTAASGKNSVSKAGITVSCTAGGFAISGGAHYRLAANSTTTISSTVGEIKSIIINGPSGSGNYSISKFGSNTGWILDSSKGTYTWSGGSSSVTVKANDGQVRPTSIVVTYTPSGGPVQYTVYLTSPITGGSVSANTTSAEKDATITLTANPTDGYTFNNIAANWSVVDPSSNAIPITLGEGNTATFTMPEKNVTVSATFTELPTHNYTISATHGTISVDNKITNGTAYEGKTLSLNASADAGYAFTSWNVYKTVDSETKVTVSGANKITMPTYDITISATFSELPIHNIAKASVLNGTIDVELSAYEGKSVSLSATPSTGYALKAWSVYKTEDPSIKVSVEDGAFSMPTYDVTVSAEFINAIVADHMTRSTTGRADNAGYDDWDSKTLSSNAIYGGNSAGGNDAIQLRGGSSSGIYTNASGGKARKITVTWNKGTTADRSLDIYGKNTPYSSSANLYNSNDRGTKIGSIVKGTSTELVINGDYAYIGLRSESNALYLDDIYIQWAECRDITISSAEWATLYLPFAVDIPSGVTAYYASDITGSTLTLLKFNNVIPANTGVIVNASAGTYTFVKSSTSPSAPETNYLNGDVTTGNTTGAGDNGKYYRLSYNTDPATDLGFYYGAEDGAAFEIEANKAYLALPAAKIPAGAPSMFRIVIEDNNVTNLNNVEVTKQATKFFKNGKLFIKKNGVVYDMMGSIVK